MKKQGGATMFFTLILENANGDQVDMTATANRYMTSRVEGLNPPPCTISTSSYAGTVINNYNNDNSQTVNQTNNSPRSLSRLEIYRQTRNALNV